MLGNVTQGYVWWAELAGVLALGSAAIIAVAALAARPVRSGVWQRTIWQTAALGLVVLVGLELMGAGSAMVGLLRARLRPPPPPPDVAAALAPAALAPAAPAPAELARGRWVPAEEPRLEPPVAEAVAMGPAVSIEAAGGWLEGAFGAGTENEEKAGPAAAPEATAAPVASHGEPLASDQPQARAGAAWPAALWLAGTGLVLVSIARARWRLGRFRRAEAIGDAAALRGRVSLLARRLGIHRPVSVLAAPGLESPVAFGLVRPSLVVPVRFAEQFDERQQDTILAHELAHLAAHDPAWQLLADLLSAVFWWQPMVWWLRVRLRAASEAAADEASLLVPGGPDVLADCLVRLGRQLLNARRLGWLSIEGPGFRSGLGRRVQRLLSLQSSGRRPPGPARLASARIALVLAMVVVSVFSTAWARPQATEAEGETAMSLMRTSWQRSLAAMALAAWLGPVGAGTAAEEKAAPPAPEKAPAASAEAHATRESPPKPAPDLREFLNKRAQLEITVYELQRRLGELRDDQDAEAGQVFEKLRKAERELREIMRQLRQQFPDAMGPPRMMSRSAAPSAGVVAVTTMPPGAPPPAAVTAPGVMAGGRRSVAGTPPLDPPERERRMKLVNAAADSLRQAGLPEQADRLMREAEAIFSGRAPSAFGMPAGYPGMSGPSGAPMSGYAGSAGPSGGPGGYSGSSGPSGMPPGYAGTSGPTGYPGTGGPPAGYPVPGYSPTGMSPYGPSADPATAEIRNQLREMQKQIEELRKQLQDLKGASPTGRSSENRR